MNSLSWNDMVFSNRNQSYGAYIIRKAYPGRVTMSFAFAMITVSAILASPMIKDVFGDEVKEKPKVVIHGPTVIDPSPRILPPPPRIKEINPPISRFVPPRVTDKEVIDDEVPEIAVVAASNVSADTDNSNVVFTEPIPEAVVEPVAESKIYITVEQQPEFPGGYQAMMKFIGQNTKYPSIARRMETEGTSFISFVVDDDGTIDNVEVIKGLSAECDEEAMRVIAKMPLWKPGKQNGQAVKVRFVLPFKFKLDR